MPVPYGRNIAGSVGEDIHVVAGPLSDARWKSGGMSIDWTTVAALGSDNSVTTINDEYFYAKAGQKVLRYGQVMCEITATGLYGPFDPTASDGRQLLKKGHCYLLDSTIFEFSPIGITTRPTAYAGGLIGGRIWLERVLQAGGGSHSLAAGPTLTEFEAAFGAFSYAY